jgi:hypothetical protein
MVRPPSARAAAAPRANTARMYTPRRAHPRAPPSSPPAQAGVDRFNVNTSLSKNWEHLQNKYVGTGHPDLTRQ